MWLFVQIHPRSQPGSALLVNKANNRGEQSLEHWVSLEDTARTQSSSLHLGGREDKDDAAPSALRSRADQSCLGKGHPVPRLNLLMWFFQ